jgi:hypothetical protein
MTGKVYSRREKIWRSISLEFVSRHRFSDAVLLKEQERLQALDCAAPLKGHSRIQLFGIAQAMP